MWISPEQARWAREKHDLVAELEDGAIVVERSFNGTDFLVKEILKEAGDAAVLEPADAREAVLAAAERLLGSQFVSRRAEIVMTPEEVAAFLDEQRTVTCATLGPRRLAASDAALVRGARRRAVGVDLREVAEGPQPRARPALHVAGRGRGSRTTSCAA